MMRERLELVIGSRAAEKRAAAVAVILLGLLALVGFTEAQEKKESSTNDEIVLLARAGRSATESRDKWISKIYDFTELQKLFETHESLRAAPAPRPSPTTSAPSKETATLAARLEMRKWVARVVQDSGWSEPMATADMRVDIAWDDDKAAIRHSLESHERLEKAIKALQDSPETNFQLELRVNRLSSEDFAKLDLSGLEAIQTNRDALAAEREEKKARVGSASETISRRLSAQNYLLSDEAMRRIYPALCEFPSYQSVLAPKLTLLNSQTGKFAHGTTLPFVTKQEPLGKKAEQPLVDVLFLGVQSETQAIALGEKRAWVRWDFQKSDLMEVKSEEQIGGK